MPRPTGFGALRQARLDPGPQFRRRRVPGGLGLDQGANRGLRLEGLGARGAFSDMGAHPLGRTGLQAPSVQIVKLFSGLSAVH
jgi:hypothetical protein